MSIEKKLDALIDALGFDVEEIPKHVPICRCGQPCEKHTKLDYVDYKLTKKPAKRSSNGHLSWCACDECKELRVDTDIEVNKTDIQYIEQFTFVVGDVVNLCRHSYLITVIKGDKVSLQQAH